MDPHYANSIRIVEWERLQHYLVYDRQADGRGPDADSEYQHYTG